MLEKFAYWKEELNLFDDDMDKYQFLIDLAKHEVSLPVDLCIPQNKIEGCVSQIWVDLSYKNNIVRALYNSDAMITKGITHIVCDCFSGLDLKTAQSITKQDFKELGIEEILSGNRRNGLSSLIDTLLYKVSKL